MESMIFRLESGEADIDSGVDLYDETQNQRVLMSHIVENVEDFPNLEIEPEKYFEQYINYVNISVYKINTISEMMSLFEGVILQKISRENISSIKKIQSGLNTFSSYITDFQKFLSGDILSHDPITFLSFFNEGISGNTSEGVMQTASYQEMSFHLKVILQEIVDQLQIMGYTQESEKLLTMFDILGTQQSNSDNFHEYIGGCNSVYTNEKRALITDKKHNFYLSFSSTSQRNELHISEELRHIYLQDILQTDEILGKIYDKHRTDSIYFDDTPFQISVITRSVDENKDEIITVNSGSATFSIIQITKPERSESGEIYYEANGNPKMIEYEHTLMNLDYQGQIYYFVRSSDEPFTYSPMGIETEGERKTWSINEFPPEIRELNNNNIIFYDNDDDNTAITQENVLANVSDNIQDKQLDTFTVEQFPIGEMTRHFLNDMLSGELFIGDGSLEELMEKDADKYFSFLRKLTDFTGGGLDTFEQISRYLGIYFKDSNVDVVLTGRLKFSLGLAIQERLHEVMGRNFGDLTNRIGDYETACASVTEDMVSQDIQTTYITQSLIGHITQWNSSHVFGGPDKVNIEERYADIDQLATIIQSGSNTKPTRISDGLREVITKDSEFWVKGKKSANKSGESIATSVMVKEGVTLGKKGIMQKCTYEYSRCVLSGLLDLYSKSVTGHEEGYTALELGYQAPTSDSIAATYPALAGYIDIEGIGGHNWSDKNFDVGKQVAGLLLDISLIMLSGVGAGLVMRGLMMLGTRATMLAVRAGSQAFSKAEALYTLYSRGGGGIKLLAKSAETVSGFTRLQRLGILGTELGLTGSAYVPIHALLADGIVGGDWEAARRQVTSVDSYVHSISLFCILRAHSAIFKRIGLGINPNLAPDEAVQIGFNAWLANKALVGGIYSISILSEVTLLYGIDAATAVVFDKHIPDLNGEYMFETIKVILGLRLQGRCVQNIQNRNFGRKQNKFRDEIMQDIGTGKELKFYVEQTANGETLLWIHTRSSQGKGILYKKYMYEEMINSTLDSFSKDVAKQQTVSKDNVAWGKIRENMYRQNTSTQAWEICAKYNDFASLESSVQETIINAIQYAHKNLVEIKYTKQGNIDWANREFMIPKLTEQSLRDISKHIYDAMEKAGIPHQISMLMLGEIIRKGVSADISSSEGFMMYYLDKIENIDPQKECDLLKKEDENLDLNILTYDDWIETIHLVLYKFTYDVSTGKKLQDFESVSDKIFSENVLQHAENLYLLRTVRKFLKEEMSVDVEFVDFAEASAYMAKNGLVSQWNQMVAKVRLEVLKMDVDLLQRRYRDAYENLKHVKIIEDIPDVSGLKKFVIDGDFSRLEGNQIDLFVQKSTELITDSVKLADFIDFLRNYKSMDKSLYQTYAYKLSRKLGNTFSKIEGTRFSSDVFFQAKMMGVNMGFLMNYSHSGDIYATNVNLSKILQDVQNSKGLARNILRYRNELNNYISVQYTDYASILGYTEWSPSQLDVLIERMNQQRGKITGTNVTLVPFTTFDIRNSSISRGADKMNEFVDEFTRQVNFREGGYQNALYMHYGKSYKEYKATILFDEALKNSSILSSVARTKGITNMRMETAPDFLDIMGGIDAVFAFEQGGSTHYIYIDYKVKRSEVSPTANKMRSKYERRIDETEYEIDIPFSDLQGNPRRATNEGIQDILLSFIDSY